MINTFVKCELKEGICSAICKYGEEKRNINCSTLNRNSWITAQGKLEQ